MIEFRKIALPDEIDAVLAIDRKIFVNFLGDVFDTEEWSGFESYWMLEHGAIVGCSAFIRHADYDESPRPAVFISSVLECYPKRAGGGWAGSRKNGRSNTPCAKDSKLLLQICAGRTVT